MPSGCLGTSASHYPPGTYDVPWQGQHADTIAIYGLTLAISAMIVFGFRSIRQYGFSLKRVILPVVGIGISLVLI